MTAADVGFHWEEWRAHFTVTPACPLCATPDYTRVANHDRYGLPIRIVKCRGCSFVYLLDKLTDEGYGRLYDSGLYRALVCGSSGDDPATYADTILTVTQEQYADRLIATVFKTAPAMTQPILDVGGSIGLLAKKVADHLQTTAVIVESSGPERTIAETRYGVRAVAQLRDLPDHERFSLALMARTIDHLTDPVGVLRLVRRRARFLWVDAVDAPAAAAGEGAWEAILKIDHPCNFTDAHLRLALTLAGWWPMETATIARNHPGWLCQWLP